MKRFLIIAMLLMLIAPALAVPEPYEMLKGRQMIPVGAPWIADDQIMYFGDDKDGYIKFDSATGYITLSGVAATALTTGGTVGANNHLTCAAGSTNLDFSLGTGTTDTTTGTNTLRGNTVIAGTKTFTTGTGAVTINGPVSIASGVDIVAAAAGSDIDYSLATTGIFKTPGGAITIGPGAIGVSGTQTIAAGKDIIAAGAGSDIDFSASDGALKTPTGTMTVGGPVSVSAAVDIVAAGLGSDIDYALSTNGIFTTPGGAVTIGPGAIGVTGTQSIASGKDIIALGGASDIDFSLSSGILKTPTGTNTIGGATVFAADKGITMTSGTGAMDFSGGSGIFKTTTGASTIGPGAVGITGAATFSKTVSFSVNATTTLDTTLTSSDTKTIYPIDASGATVTLTLPDAATVPGRMYIVSTLVDMVGNNIVIATTGGSKLGGVGGADTLTSTDVLAALTVVSDGTHYVRIGSAGTWT
jgi:hypothetical protein